MHNLLGEQAYRAAVIETSEKLKPLKKALIKMSKEKMIDKYLECKAKIQDMGYSQDIDWAENIKPCRNSNDFLIAYIWVICNSGMKYTIAKKIYEKILGAISEGKPISSVFGYKTCFIDFLTSKDKILFCESLPWIGPITKYHLAKNLGVDCIKPDRHLVRIAKNNGFKDPFEMCEYISETIEDTPPTNIPKISKHTMSSN